MKFPLKYKCLDLFEIKKDNYKLVPIRYDDRLNIMKWRNDQMYHLRQSELLTEQSQDKYFSEVVAKLFNEEKPKQILFSYLKDEVCIGYGGLVHINWIDKNAEISFVLNPKENFKEHWGNYLIMLNDLSFSKLNLHKIYTYAFDIRPNLYPILLNNGFNEEARLKEHCFFNNDFIDVIIHEKRNPFNSVTLREAQKNDVRLLFDWANDVDVRANALDSSAILFENHIKWYESKLNDKNSLIYILENYKGAIGQIRIDKNFDDNYWLIDYSIDVLYRSMGYGRKILNELVKRNKEKILVGFVKKSNISSQKVFEKLAFNKEIMEDKGLIKYTYDK